MRIVSESGSADLFDLTESRGWLEMMEFKGGQDGYGFTENEHGLSDRMVDLVSSIQERGVLYPVGIETNRDGEYYLGNGHHRTVAALLLALDNIPVYISEFEDGGAINFSETSESEGD